MDDKKAESPTAIISEFYLYFEKVNPGLIVLRQLLFLLSVFLSNSLTMLNIYYFNPNFILIGFHLTKFVQLLIDEDPKKFYFIIFYILQLFSLLIYLEIIELNFCGLNKNTKRNIELRGKDEISLMNRNDSLTEGENIEINEDYYIKSLDNSNEVKDPLVEMLPQTDTESVSTS